MSFPLHDEPCFCPAEWPPNSVNYGIYYHNSQLVTIVANNNLLALKEFGDTELTIVDANGHTPLHLSVILNKRDVFDYLMTVENLDLNARNALGQTAIHLAVKVKAEYYLRELIKRGAEINTQDARGCTPLHVASYHFMPHIWHILYENGANIDTTNFKIKSPLFHACEAGNGSNVEMLLYYGAEANLPNIYNILPLTMAMAKSQHADFIETLFNFTVIEEPHLNLLTTALKRHSPLFDEIFNKIKKVVCTQDDLSDFCGIQANLKTSTIIKIFNKFGYIFTEMLMSPSRLCHFMITDLADLRNIERLMDLFTLFLEHEPSKNFFQDFIYGSIVINHLFFLDEHYFLPKESLMQFLYFLYSYGFPCEPDNLLGLYKRHGYCELLKFLLELGFEGSPARSTPVMGYFILFPYFIIDDYISKNPVPYIGDEVLFKFFTNRSVRRYFLGWPEFSNFVMNAPRVSSLVELARDAARTHILDVFNVTETHEFYQLIKKLPICEIHKKILRYEMPLYSIPKRCYHR